MPEGGVDLTPDDKLLNQHELAKVLFFTCLFSILWRFIGFLDVVKMQIIKFFVHSGVRKIRFTGGEPTVLLNSFPSALLMNFHVLVYRFEKIWWRCWKRFSPFGDKGLMLSQWPPMVICDLEIVVDVREHRMILQVSYWNESWSLWFPWEWLRLTFHLIQWVSTLEVLIAEGVLFLNHSLVDDFGADKRKFTLITRRNGWDKVMAGLLLLSLLRCSGCWCCLIGIEHALQMKESRKQLVRLFLKETRVSHFWRPLINRPGLRRFEHKG